MIIIKSRTLSFVIILFIYFLAFVAGYCFYGWLSGTALWRMFFADGIATVVVFIFSLLFQNASVYDPYWSIAPLVIIPFWAIIRGGVFSFLDVLFLIAVFIWGIRLTLNWAATFKGLSYQDWRYTMLRHNNPKLWFLINLTGIHLMPTFIVFGGMIPACLSIFNIRSANGVTIVGFLICIFFICVQFISDNQLARFRKNAKDSKLYIDEGLWKITRHPNYLGEIMFWWGIYIMQLSILPQYWFTIVGPIMITMLFIFISIPLMEKHVLEKRPGYAEYKKRVSMLIPLPKNIRV